MIVIIQKEWIQNRTSQPFNKHRYDTIASDLFSLQKGHFLPICRFLHPQFE